jgi:uncharacterized HAD superfamily protein
MLNNNLSTKTQHLKINFLHGTQRNFSNITNNNLKNQEIKKESLIGIGPNSKLIKEYKNSLFSLSTVQ